MSEVSSSEPVTVEGNKLVIHRGEPARSKEAFLGIMEQRAQRLDRASYAKLAGVDSSMGHFQAAVFQVPEGKAIEDAIIYVNEDDFRINGEDFTDVIPVSVRHEAFEMWMYVKNGWSLSPPPERIGRGHRVAVAHGLATREEYRYAFQIGKAERYLEYIKNWSMRLPEAERRRFIAENEEAYKRAKSQLRK